MKLIHLSLCSIVIGLIGCGEAPVRVEKARSPVTSRGQTCEAVEFAVTYSSQFFPNASGDSPRRIQGVQFDIVCGGGTGTFACQLDQSLDDCLAQRELVSSESDSGSGYSPPTY